MILWGKRRKAVEDHLVYLAEQNADMRKEITQWAKDYMKLAHDMGGVGLENQELKEADPGLLLSQIEITAALLRQRDALQRKYDVAYEAHRRKDHIITTLRREEEALNEEVLLERMDKLELLDQYQYAIRYLRMEVEDH